MITIPPIQDITLLKTGRFTTAWIRWFQAVYRILTGQEPIQLARYTLATLPVAPDGTIAYVSDASGGPTIVFSSGGQWYISQGVVVS